MAAKDLDSNDIKKQELDDITKCCICTEVFTDPKALPCIHTFCMKCIQEAGLKTNKGPGDEMPCPICRRMFKIPTEGFHGLSKNFFIERLIQVAHLSEKSASSAALCSLCLEYSNGEAGKETPTADAYCFDCKRELCKECRGEHMEFKATRKHTLIPISEHEVGQNIMTQLLPSVCQLHEEKVLDVYCADCKIVVCAICFIDDHRIHEGSHVKKFVEDFRKQIKSNVEPINEWKFEAEAKKSKLLKVKEDIQKMIEKLECDVTSRKDELMQLIEKHANYLMHDLCLIRQGKLKEVQMETDDIETYILSLETYNSYCQTIMVNGLDSDICCAFTDLSVRAVKLQEQRQLRIRGEIQPFNCNFIKSGLESFLGESSKNLIGELEETMKTLKTDAETLKQKLETTKIGELLSKSNPVLVQTIRTKDSKEKGKSINGLTILGKELFLLSETSSEVDVYDTINLSFSRRWKLEELMDPKDVVSCRKNKCLYICDYKFSSQSKEILRIDSNGKLTKKWSTASNFGCLSVTNESNIILTIFSKNKLIEYSPEGQLIREINLSSKAGICYPLHAVKLANGQFAVSHGWTSADLHRLCVIDAEGKHKKSFGGRCGSTKGQMDVPIYLAVDRNGFVLVADRDNSRVLLFDPDLELKREILSRDGHGLRRPRRILLDESNGRLFVADNENFRDDRILVFDFK